MTTMFIAIHALAASGVVLLAPVQLIRRTKDRKHRWIGRSWVILMYFVCISGMFIYTLSGSFTVFHALAIFTFATTTIGVISIRLGKVRRHVSMMVGSWLGALAAGTFGAIIPSRDIPRLAVAEPGLLWEPSPSSSSPRRSGWATSSGSCLLRPASRRTRGSCGRSP